RDLGVVVNIHLDQRDLAARVGDRLLQGWRELFARPAPRRPEVDQNGLARRGGEHVGAERGRRDLLDRTRFYLMRDRAAHLRHVHHLQPGGRQAATPMSHILPTKWRRWAFYSTAA